MTGRDRVLGAVGGGMLAILFSSFWVSILRGLRSRSWPRVSGEIIVSEAVISRGGRGSKMYEPSVRYAYRVGGHNYEGDRVFYGFTDFYLRRGAEAVIEKYPIGQLVDVYYDPTDPNSAVLKPGVTLRTWVAVGLLGLLVLFILSAVIGV